MNNATGCTNPELGQLGDNGAAYRRWQKRMLRYRRGNKTGEPGTNSRKGRRHRSGRQHGQGQSHNSNSGHNSQDARSGFSKQRGLTAALTLWYSRLWHGNTPWWGQGTGADRTQPLILTLTLMPNPESHLAKTGQKRDLCRFHIER